MWNDEKMKREDLLKKWEAWTTVCQTEDDDNACLEMVYC